ncbi:MAG: hypothetical protein SGBAC_013589, partial [Bacillariaceae sp.]
MVQAIVIGLLLLLQVVRGTRHLQQQQHQRYDSCAPLIPFDPSVHKQVYQMGCQQVANQGLMRNFNLTLGDYLTATAGNRFDPPVRFEISAFQDNNLAYDLMEAKEIDFVMVNPFQGTCLEAEFGTQTLVTAVRTTAFGNQKNTLSTFAGMFITHVDNYNINKLADLKDKVVAAGNPAAVAVANLQWHEMQKKGLSYLNDPAAIVFTGSMVKIINGVIDKTYDVGFLRTGFVEGLLHRNPNLNVSAYKVIGVRKDDGTVDETFPLERSTPTVPEWSISASPHTPADVSREVQEALLALKQHGITGLARAACLNTNANNTAQCDDLASVDSQVLCEANIESVTAAGSVMSSIDHMTYRPPLSFHKIRKMALDLGSMQQDPSSDSLKCFRPSEFYDQIVCPKGFFKLSPDAMLTSCKRYDFACPEGADCICKPCFEALPIEVAPTEEYTAGSGCTKMSICSTIAQNEVVQYTVVDNQKLEGGRSLWAKTLEDGIDTAIAIEPGPNPHSYLFSVSTSRVGIFILEIYDGDEQIDASPVRVRVEYTECPADKEASDDGVCECKASSITISGNCVAIWLAVLVALAPVAIIAAIVMYVFVKGKEREANSLWIVKRSDLKFSDPAVVIGHGSFGFVLQAEYRGSKVAIKRALAPKGTQHRTESVQFGSPLKLGSRDSSLLLIESDNKEEALPSGRSTDSTKSLDLETGAVRREDPTPPSASRRAIRIATS